MDAFKGAIGGYIDLDKIQLSKVNVAVGVGAIVLGRLLWDELKVNYF
jgi:hypothetical protein